MKDEIKFVRRFAFIPVNLFPRCDTSLKGMKRKDFIWLRIYYAVYKYEQHTWAVNDPKGFGWTWLGNSITNNITELECLKQN